MANIRGISIKTVKHFIGTEGPAYQGNIYIGSKKVAFWSQDGNGGPDWFDMMNGFSKKKLVEAMKPYVDQKSIVQPQTPVYQPGQMPTRTTRPLTGGYQVTCADHESQTVAGDTAPLTAEAKNQMVQEFDQNVNGKTE